MACEFPLLVTEGGDTGPIELTVATWPLELAEPARRWLGDTTTGPLRARMPALGAAGLGITAAGDRAVALAQRTVRLGCEALILTRAAPDQAWIAEALNYPHCWVRGRVRFPGYTAASAYAALVLCVSPDPARWQAFAQNFAAYGAIGGCGAAGTAVAGVPHPAVAARGTGGRETAFLTPLRAAVQNATRILRKILRHVTRTHT